MFHYITLDPMFDNHEWNRIVVPHDLVREILGGRNAGESLRRFSDDTGIALDISDSMYTAGLARTIATPVDVDTIAELTEHPFPNQADRSGSVSFLNGTPWTPYQEKKQKSKIRASLLRPAKRGLPTTGLIDYLHQDRVQHWLTKTGIEKWDKMSAIAASLDEPRREMADTIIKKNRQCMCLGYTSVANTDRIYAVGCNIMQLPREVRHVFYEDAYNIDLKASQLSIVASVWGIPMLTEFLAAGDVWHQWLDYLELGAEFKGALKEWIYALLYGMSKKHLAERACNTLGGDAILAHPVVKKLLDCRKRQLGFIMKEGGAIDGYGEWRSTGDIEHGNMHKKASSILARQAQSYETRIMLVVYEELRDQKDILITGWLHDGCYVVATNHKERTNRILSRVRNRLEDRAMDLGIQMEIEIKHGEP